MEKKKSHDALEYPPRKRISSSFKSFLHSSTLASKLSFFLRFEFHLHSNHFHIKVNLLWRFEEKWSHFSSTKSSSLASFTIHTHTHTHQAWTRLYQTRSGRHPLDGGGMETIGQDDSYRINQTERDMHWRDWEGLYISFSTYLLSSQPFSITQDVFRLSRSFFFFLWSLIDMCIDLLEVDF